MKKFARWLSEKLLEERDGKPRMPGSSSVHMLVEANGTKFTLLSNGESFDVFHGYGQMYSFSLPSRDLIRVALFVLWWWAKDTWFGLKFALWRWAQRRSGA